MQDIQLILTLYFYYAAIIVGMHIWMVLHDCSYFLVPFHNN